MNTAVMCSSLNIIAYGGRGNKADDEYLMAGGESWQPRPVQGGLAGSLRPWQVIVAPGQTDAIKHV